MNSYVDCDLVTLSIHKPFHSITCGNDASDAICLSVLFDTQLHNCPHINGVITIVNPEQLPWTVYKTNISVPALSLFLFSTEQVICFLTP